MKILLVLSGKGGVGKSTFCAALGTVLALQSKKVGLLDADLCGPSLPNIFPQNNRSVIQSEDGWIPLEYEENIPGSIRVMSMGYLLSSPNDAVVWRGPKKTAMLKQLLNGVAWGDDLDYLIIDTPPGTSDEHISLAQMLENDPRFIGAIIITTPQWASLSAVRKEIEFCHLVKIPLVGLVENMREAICEHCGECASVFGHGDSAKALAAHYHMPYLTSIPLVPGSLQVFSDSSFVSNLLSNSIITKSFINVISSI